jgi:hypothetical protein
LQTSEFDKRKKDGSVANDRSSNSARSTAVHSSFAFVFFEKCQKNPMIAKFRVNMAYVHGGVLDVAVKIAIFDLCLSLLHTLAMSVRTGRVSGILQKDERMIVRRRVPVMMVAGVAAFLFSGALQAQSGGATSRDAIGSWFGRAVADQVICTPGSPGCPVPAEIIMVFTVNADGSFIGIDSNIFAGGNHSTAHGEWVATPPNGIKANFTLLQSSPTGVFIGGFKNVFEATAVESDKLEGKITAYLYAYTDASGKAIIGPDGLPTPNPLSPPEQCATQAGCTSLGTFKFIAKRVKAPAK